MKKFLIGGIIVYVTIALIGNILIAYLPGSAKDKDAASTVRKLLKENAELKRLFTSKEVTIFDILVQQNQGAIRLSIYNDRAPIVSKELGIKLVDLARSVAKSNGVKMRIQIELLVGPPPVGTVYWRSPFPYWIPLIN